MLQFAIQHNRFPFETHPPFCTKAVLITRQTSYLRTVQLLFGRYLGIEVDDAIKIAEKIDI